MIDLRCHILDGMPCGPDSFAESLEMCHTAAAGGVRTIVATPRWEVGRTEPPLPFEECQRKIERLNAEMRGSLSLGLGFALQFGADLPALVERHGSKLALAGKRYLLVSLPSVNVPTEAEGVWRSLALMGFSVVLAHPECNTILRRNDARLARWVAEGMTIQVDAASVDGTHGREVRRFALECLRKYEGCAIVASNARWDVNQINSLRNARAELVSNIGVRQATRYLTDTPAALIGESSRLNNGPGLSSRRLTAVFRSISPINTLTGES
jgi:protein-tyrosine phosphatase